MISTVSCEKKKTNCAKHDTLVEQTLRNHFHTNGSAVVRQNISKTTELRESVQAPLNFV